MPASSRPVNHTTPANSQTARKGDKKSALPTNEIATPADKQTSSEVSVQNQPVDTDELWRFVNSIGNREDDDERQLTDEMTPNEKQALYRAVQSGDVDLVDEMLLQLPSADINMTWFSENLLMAALRAGHSDMALFLLDNGVDYNYANLRIDIAPTEGHVGSCYSICCRQMAYELGMLDVVDAIDELKGNVWPKSKTSDRVKRLRRTMQRPSLGDQLQNDEPKHVDSERKQTAGKRLKATVDIATLLANRTKSMNPLNATPRQKGVVTTSPFHVVFCPTPRARPTAAAVTDKTTDERSGSKRTHRANGRPNEATGGARTEKHYCRKSNIAPAGTSNSNTASQRQTVRHRPDVGHAT